MKDVEPVFACCLGALADMGSVTELAITVGLDLAEPDAPSLISALVTPVAEVAATTACMGARSM